MDTRIMMLYHTGIIDKSTKDYLIYVINQLEKKGFDKESDNMARMITHFAMAISRQQQGKIIDEMDSFLFEDIKNNENYEQAKNLWAEMNLKLPIEFNENEVRFMVLHLSILIGDK
ncbi:PRD domain-containing protein [Clostridioides difficile]|nr:PRD domain-containing protein [Clostridioides difficile]MDV9710110.1 PRD domain-containing protein [Clostridioides difficile]